MTESAVGADAQFSETQWRSLRYLNLYRFLLASLLFLASAEADAWACRDFDTLSRLYMPLQEARRQRRLRCAEGVVCLDLIATGPGDKHDGRKVVENYLHGQLLVAGWQSIAPALEVREYQRTHGLFLETFLAAAYQLGAGGRVVAIVPTADVALPQGGVASIDELMRRLPAHCIVVSETELLNGVRKGSADTFSFIMSLWERLHRPFLAVADMQADPIRKIEAYRRAIEVDYACELAHQKASDVARGLVRNRS